MEEFFLHFIWKNKLFNQRDLSTREGHSLQIIHPGYDHTSAGPDFRMGRIRIDGLEWVGAVEIHVKSADWYAHGHEHDPNYDRVILHVVWEDDRPVRSKNGKAIPTIELQGRIHRRVFDRWKELQADMHWIPCEPFIGDLDELFWKGHWERMAVTRLEERERAWELRLHQNHYHWEETFYQFLSRSFGLKENADLFEQVALRTPLRLIRREAHSLLHVQALLVGQAGWTTKRSRRSIRGDYKKAYGLLQKKYHLSPIDPNLWKFGGVRPANHPDQRMLQLGRLLYNTPYLATDLTYMEQAGDWFTFCKSAIGSGFGKEKARIVLLNALVPYLFYLGRWKGDERLIRQSLGWLEQCHAENNHIIKSFQDRGVPIQNALDSQAAEHQFRHYCRQKKCVICGVGKRVLSR